MQGVGRDLRQSRAFDREHEQCEDRTDQRPWGDAMAVQETMEICEYGKMPWETSDGRNKSPRAIRKDDRKPVQLEIQSPQEGNKWM